MDEYKPTTFYVVFESFRSQRFLVPVLMATRYSLNTGVPGVLIDLIRMYLITLVKHQKFINCVGTTLRFFLCSAISLVIREDSVCQGARLVVSGKIDGGDRKKHIEFYIGAIPRSSIKVAIAYDQVIII